MMLNTSFLYVRLHLGLRRRQLIDPALERCAKVGQGRAGDAALVVGVFLLLVHEAHEGTKVEVESARGGGWGGGVEEVGG